jgi:hypothetical protein
MCYCLRMNMWTMASDNLLKDPLQFRNSVLNFNILNARHAITKYRSLPHHIHMPPFAMYRARLVARRRRMVSCFRNQNKSKQSTTNTQRKNHI